MRIVHLIVDDEAADYCGPDRSMQGYTGSVTRETANGLWVTFRDYFIDSERVPDTAWAYEYAESVLPAVMTQIEGRDMNVYHKPWVSVYFPRELVRDRRN